MPKVIGIRYISQSEYPEYVYDLTVSESHRYTLGNGQIVHNSGKDFVMSRTLHGHGLTEINSDTAFEHLMKKNGLSPKMPDHEKDKRNLVRGRAKNVTSEKQRLALVNRQGVIINSTADDPERIAAMKERLEGLGYKTMMLHVHTSDEVSKQRNIERGDAGSRTVPEDIRSEKWQKSLAAGPYYRKLFKDDYIHFDNSEDLRKVTPERKREIEDKHHAIFRKARAFTATPSDNPEATAWQQREMQRQGASKFSAPRASTRPQQTSATVPGSVPTTISFNRTKPIGKSMAESNNTPSDREWGKKSLTDIYKKDTPGQTPKPVKMVYKKKLEQEGISNLSNDGIGPMTGVIRSPTGFGGGYSIPIAESITSWINNQETKDRFIKKYGDNAESKLQEAASRLNKIGTNDKSAPKTFGSMRESLDKGILDTSGFYSGRGGKDGDIGEDKETITKPRKHKYIKRPGQKGTKNHVRK